MTTPAQLAKDLREQANGVIFNDSYGFVNSHFTLVVDTVATMLENMRHCDTLMNESALRELVQQFASLVVYKGDPHAYAFDPIDRWLQQWFDRSNLI